MSGALTVLHPGTHSSVQDLGRAGLGRLGLGVGGAADRGSLELANRLVGNAPAAAGIEAALGGLALRAEADLLVAVTGAAGPVTVGSASVGRNAPLPLPAGAVLTLGAPSAGLRTYVAVAGGLDTPVILGSRSHSSLGDLGAPLASAEVLPVGGPPNRLPDTDVAPVAAPPTAAARLEITPGPRLARLTPAAREHLVGQPYAVTADLDRTGVRLDGPALGLADTSELPSEGMVRGAVQVPPAGRPILFLSDHPATGGYPVVAVLTPRAADRAAQLTPGMSVGLVWSRATAP